MNDLVARRVFLAAVGLLFTIGLSTGIVSQSFANVFTASGEEKALVAATVRPYASPTLKSSASAAQSLYEVNADLDRSNAKLTLLTTDTREDSKR
jgi:hypothetical protein